MPDLKPHCATHTEHTRRLERLEDKGDRYLEGITEIRGLVVNISQAAEKQAQTVNNLLDTISSINIDTQGNMRGLEICETKLEDEIESVLAHVENEQKSMRWWIRLFIGLIFVVTIIGTALSNYSSRQVIQQVEKIIAAKQTTTAPVGGP